MLDISKLFEDGHKPQILIVDDNKEFGEMLGQYVNLLKGKPIYTNKISEAKMMLEQFQDNKMPIDLAILDLRFPVGSGEETTHAHRGTELLRYIKVEHPNVACLMISGESITPSGSLDFRDHYDLDYFLEKDKIDPVKVGTAISRAIERLRAVQNEKESLRVTFEKISSRELREFIDFHFNEEELKTLCFDLEIPYEQLDEENKVGKVRELINYSNRHGRYYDLVKHCKHLRSHAFRNR